MNPVAISGMHQLSQIYNSFSGSSPAISTEKPAEIANPAVTVEPLSIEMSNCSNEIQEIFRNRIIQYFALLEIKVSITVKTSESKASPVIRSTSQACVEPLTIRTKNAPLLLMVLFCDTISDFAKRLNIDASSVRVVNEEEEPVKKKTKVFVIGNRAYEVFQKPLEPKSGTFKTERLVNIHDWLGLSQKLTKDPNPYILFKNKKQSAPDAQGELPFRREYRILQQYDTPLVVRPVAYFYYRGKPGENGTGDIKEMIVMPRFDRSLHDLMSLPFIPTNHKNSLFMELAKGVKAIHDRKDVHRDLKPENILIHPIKVSDDDRPTRTRAISIAISDFGSVRQLTQDNKLPLSLDGTTRKYLAPECASCALSIERKKEEERAMTSAASLGGDREDVASSLTPWIDAIGPANDIWALGVIFFRLMDKEKKNSFPNSVQKALFYSDIRKKGREESASTGVIAYACLEAREKGVLKDVTEPSNKLSIEHLVWRMLQMNPADRPTAEDVVKRLGEVQRGEFDRRSIPLHSTSSQM